MKQIANSSESASACLLNAVSKFGQASASFKAVLMDRITYPSKPLPKITIEDQLKMEKEGQGQGYGQGQVQYHNHNQPEPAATTEAANNLVSQSTDPVDNWGNCGPTFAPLTSIFKRCTPWLLLFTKTVMSYRYYRGTTPQLLSFVRAVECVSLDTLDLTLTAKKTSATLNTLITARRPLQTQSFVTSPRNSLGKFSYIMRGNGREQLQKSLKLTGIMSMKFHSSNQMQREPMLRLLSRLFLSTIAQNEAVLSMLETGSWCPEWELDSASTWVKDLRSAYASGSDMLSDFMETKKEKSRKDEEHQLKEQDHGHEYRQGHGQKTYCTCRSPTKQCFRSKQQLQPQMVQEGAFKMTNFLTQEKLELKRREEVARAAEASLLQDLKCEELRHKVEQQKAQEKKEIQRIKQRLGHIKAKKRAMEKQQKRRFLRQRRLQRRSVERLQGERKRRKRQKKPVWKRRNNTRKTLKPESALHECSRQKESGGLR